MRLQKLLASAGFGSRRDVERFLTEERVTVNGRVATLGDRADPTVDEIRFDGERLLKERPTYWIVNKPRGDGQRQRGTPHSHRLDAIVCRARLPRRPLGSRNIRLAPDDE
jgi:16S rRNA U516 pseudouridylate synthase RsuA-like enzyme